MSDLCPLETMLRSVDLPLVDFVTVPAEHLPEVPCVVINPGAPAHMLAARIESRLGYVSDALRFVAAASEEGPAGMFSALHLLSRDVHECRQIAAYLAQLPRGAA